MPFEYCDDTEAVLQRVLGGKDEFEDQIAQASRADDIGQVAVHSVAPGLSGAAVFLIRRIGVRGGGFIPWVVKVSSDPKLIIEERENNLKLVQGKLAAAPKLVQTGSSKLLIFEFAGVLADYNPKTLRAGYGASGADALAVLMRHIVTSLKAINRVGEDTTSCVNRMLLAQTLEAQQNWSSRVPPDVVRRLRHSWSKTLGEKDRFARIRSTGHGDLNSGNVLFEPGTGSPPVFIDFASMRRSKDNKGYEEGYHFPFWDHAKLERDLQTRLFLKEAVDAKVDRQCVIDAIKAVNGIAVATAQAPCEPVAKLRRATSALREAMQKEYSPAELAAYRVVLAYAMLTVLFRERPDAEVQDLQYLVAAESSIALLADPLSPLPSAEKASAMVIGSGERTADGRDRSTVLDVPAPTVPAAASVERSWAGRLARAFTPVNIVGALVITVIVVALIVYRFQFAREPGAEPPPKEIAQANSGKPAENTENRSPQTPSANPPSGGTLVTPPASTSKPKMASLAEPPWKDVEARVRQEFFSIKNLKKSGAFQCAKAPNETTQVWNWQWEPYTAAAADLTCRQDVELTQQGGNEVLQLFQVAVLFRRSNDRWDFLKVESRPIGPDH